MAYTLLQLQQMGATPVQPTTPAPAQGSYTADQLQQMGAKPVQENSDFNLGDAAQSVGKGLASFGKDYVDSVGKTWAETPQNLVNDVTSGAADMTKALDKNTLTSIPSAGDIGNTLKGSAKVVFGTASDAINAIFAPITGAIGASTKNIANLASEVPAVQSIATSGFGDNVQKAQDAVSQIQKQYPGATKLLNDVFNTVAGLVGERVAPGDMTQTGTDLSAIKTKVSSTVDSSLNTLKSGTENVVDKVKSMSPFTSTTEGLTPDEINTKIQGVANDWQSPTSINKSSYNNARASLAKDPEIPRNLAKNGLNPYSHIEDGVYDTKETAQIIRNDTGKLSSDILRPSLKEADYSTPKTPIADLKITPETNYPAGFNEAVQSKISTEMDALQRKYPDGLSLENMLDEKITYDKNGGYKEYKPEADNISAVANRSIADEMRSQLDVKVPPEIPIKEFNAELSSRYRMADYLEALNGKKAPVSLTQNIARLVTKYGFAKLGSMIGGGDVISAFGGYQIGKMIESFAENLTNPMRDTFLRNLKTSNPEAFKQVSKYLSDAEIRRASTLALPSGSTNGVPNIIAPAAPADVSKVEVIPATKVKPTANPKTGRMQKTYSSSSK